MLLKEMVEIRFLFETILDDSHVHLNIWAGSFSFHDGIHQSKDVIINVKRHN